MSEIGIGCEADLVFILPHLRILPRSPLYIQNNNIIKSIAHLEDRVVMMMMMMLLLNGGDFCGNIFLAIDFQKSPPSHLIGDSERKNQVCQSKK